MATETVIVECARMRERGLAAVDRLARATLAARREGCELELRHPGHDLLELIVFMGLDGCLGVEVKRQTEHRE